MPENTYQKLAELVKKSPKLFANGGLFGGINENHAVFNLFADYLKKEKRRNGHIPKTINSENFINYLISEGTQSEAEIAEIDKKFQALKKEGQLNDQLANPQKNTLYNFALLLDEIGILEGNQSHVTSGYNQALKESLQSGVETGEAGRGEETGPAGVPNVETLGVNAETPEPDITEIGTENAEITEAQLQTRTETVSSGTGAETGAGVEAETGTGTGTPTDKIKKPEGPASAPASAAEQSAAEKNEQDLPEAVPTGIGAATTEYTSVKNQNTPTVQPTFSGDDGRTPTGKFRGSLVFAGRTLPAATGTRQKIRPMRAVKILASQPGGESFGRMVSPNRRMGKEGQTGQAQTDTQLQFEQAQRTQSAQAGGQGRTKKRKSAGMRIAKYAALGSASIPILPLLGSGSAKAAGFDFVTLILNFLF